MPYVKISELTEASSTFNGTELIEIVQSGVNLKKKPGSIILKNFWSGTQAAYDVLGTYDADTIYFITGA